MKNETHRIRNFSERKFPHLVSYFLNTAAPSMYEIYRYPFMYRRFAGCFFIFPYGDPAGRSRPDLSQLLSETEYSVYLSPAPHAVPHAAGFSSGLSPAPHAVPHAAGFSSGLSPAPHAVPHAAGFSSGLSPAPHAVPHAAAGAASSFLFHPNRFESAIIVYLRFLYQIFISDALSACSFIVACPLI